MSMPRLRRRPVLSALLIAAAVACNSQGGAPNPEGPPDLSASPSPDASDPGMLPDLASPSPIGYLKQLPASTNVDIVRGIAADPSGNLFVGCMFSDTTDFGDGPRSTRGNHDVALLKLNPRGELLWVRTFGTPDADTVLRVASDPGGSVVITGNFTGTLDFGGGPVTTRGKQDYYLAKYSPEGRLVFGKAVGSTEFEGSNAGLTTDASGNVFFAGTYGIVVGGSAPIDLGGGPLVSNGASDAFLVKYDPVGGHIFSTHFGGKYIDHINDLVVMGDGDIVIGGDVMGTIDLGGGPIVPPAEANRWAFVARLNSAGAYKWAASYLTDGAEVYQLAGDSSGAVTAAGSFVKTLQTRTASLSAKNDQTHGFVLRLDAAGKETWARVIATGAERDFPYTVRSDGEKIYLGGSFTGTANFGSGMGSAMDTGGFLVSYSPAGTPLALRLYGGDSFTSVNSVAKTNDALFIGGYFDKSVSFEGTALTAKGFTDGFILKLGTGVVP